MRTLRLGRTFDAVFAHDVVDYMTTEDDLRQAVDEEASDQGAGTMPTVAGCATSNGRGIRIPPTRGS